MILKWFINFINWFFFNSNNLFALFLFLNGKHIRFYLQCSINPDSTQSGFTAIWIWWRRYSQFNIICKIAPISPKREFRQENRITFVTSSSTSPILFSFILFAINNGPPSFDPIQQLIDINYAHNFALLSAR